jgi:hypothetical protein
MTILDQITREAKALSTQERQTALRLIRSLRRGSKNKSGASIAPAIDKKRLHPALRAIAGMWKGRTDLPRDPVEAVKVLRSRMKSRGRNA